MDLASALYERAPAPARLAMATARGLQLWAWRYGPGFDDLVGSAEEREYWSAAEWDGYCAERLEHVLTIAARTGAYGNFSSRSDITELSSWPLLNKRSVREHPARYRNPDYRRRWLLFEEHTSGTTGTPLTLWIDRPGVRAWYALFEQRARRWNGVDRHDRWAIVGGQMVVPAAQQDAPFWVENLAGRQLYLSAFHISPSNAAAYAGALRRHRPRYVVGYPSALTAMADACEEASVHLPEVEVVITNAEPLLDYQRHRIAQAFSAPVRNTYGMSEAVGGATECSEGRLHLWPEAGVIEVLDDETDVAVAPGEIGRLVFTGLLNRAMPLVRYECGDRGAANGAGCPCGRTLPILAAIEGRSDDVVLTADGRRIGRLDGMFKADLPLREAQIVQKDIGRFEIVCVAATIEDEPTLRSELPRRLCERVGEATVDVRFVDRIARTKAGKFRAVVSELSSG